MSKRVTSLTPEQAKAEADALLDKVVRAATPTECAAALDGIAAAEQAKAKQDETDALVNARNRGDVMWRWYRALKQDKGEQAGDPRDVDFSKVRDALSIPPRPKQGETGTPWHGMAYQTAEQAYSLRQYAPERDGLVEQAWRKFCATADREQVKYLGNRPGNIIGLATFARRVAKGTDGLSLPTSGTMAQRRDNLVEQVIAAANAKISRASAAESEQADKDRALREQVARGSTLPLVAGVPNLTSLLVSVWTDEQVQGVIDALRAVKGWRTKDGRTEQTPEQTKQAEQVANLAAKAEQVTPEQVTPEQGAPSVLSTMTPEQVAALPPETIAILSRTPATA